MTSLKYASVYSGLLVVMFATTAYIGGAVSVTRGQHAKRNSVLLAQILNAKQAAKSNGQSEQCWIEDAEEPASKELKPLVSQDLATVSLKLDKLSGRCADHASGWWTYSVCLNEEIKQSHLEGGGWYLSYSQKFLYTLQRSKCPYETCCHSVLRTVWSLGTFMAERMESKYPVAVVQHYEGGQTCDETKTPRKSVVYIACCSDAKLKIKSLHETEICSYTIFMCSSVLCELGFLEKFQRHDPYLGLDLLKAQCFRYKAQWWTYEVCIGQTAKQYHVADGDSRQELSEEFSLGEFHNAWQAKPRKSIAIDRTATSPLYIDNTGYNPGLLQHYSGGSPCEVEDRQREAWVRFTCDEDAVKPRIKAVTEIATCIYEINLKTHYVCGHSVYDKPKPKVIKCSTGGAEMDGYKL